MASYDDDTSEPRGSRSEVRARLAGPAIALIVTAIISILGWIGYLGYNIVTLPAQRELQEQLMKQQQQQFQQKGLNAKQMEQVQQFQQMGMNIGIGLVIGLTIIGILGALLILIGGLKMKNAQSYGLALTASIVAVIPCVSPCCLLGIPFGIWALVVLNNPDVKAAFR
jgi:hypothetical protein